MRDIRGDLRERIAYTKGQIAALNEVLNSLPPTTVSFSPFSLEKTEAEKEQTHIDTSNGGGA